MIGKREAAIAVATEMLSQAMANSEVSERALIMRVATSVFAANARVTKWLKP